MRVQHFIVTQNHCCCVNATVRSVFIVGAHVAVNNRKVFSVTIGMHTAGSVCTLGNV